MGVIYISHYKGVPFRKKYIHVLAVCTGHGLCTFNIAQKDMDSGLSSQIRRLYGIHMKAATNLTFDSHL